MRVGGRSRACAIASEVMVITGSTGPWLTRQMVHSLLRRRAAAHRVRATEVRSSGKRNETRSGVRGGKRAVHPGAACNRTLNPRRRKAGAEHAPLVVYGLGQDPGSVSQKDVDNSTLSLRGAAPNRSQRSQHAASGGLIFLRWERQSDAQSTAGTRHDRQFRRCYIMLFNRTPNPGNQSFCADD